MSTTEMPSIADGGPGVYARIENRLDRIEDKLDKRLDTLDTKVDGVSSRQDRLEGKLDGVLGVIRWLGPSAIVALVYGIGKGMGLW